MGTRTLLISLFIFASHYSFGQYSKPVEYNGLYFGFGLGTSFSDNKNNVLSHPALFDLLLDARGLMGNLKNSLAIGICGSFYAKTKEPLDIYYSDTVVSITKYQWAQWGLEYGREIWKNDRLRLDLIAGFGHGGQFYYNDDKGNEVKKSSFHFSTGFSFLYPLSRSRYLQLKTQYNIANYNLNDNLNPDFSGNYIITKLIIARGRRN